MTAPGLRRTDAKLVISDTGGWLTLGDVELEVFVEQFEHPETWVSSSRVRLDVSYASFMIWPETGNVIESFGHAAAPGLVTILRTAHARRAPETAMQEQHAERWEEYMQNQRLAMASRQVVHQSRGFMIQHHGQTKRWWRLKGRPRMSSATPAWGLQCEPGSCRSSEL